MNYPDNNPKTLAGAAKVPLHLVPPSAIHYLALALADGARKYGPYNWRDIPISSSVYRAARQRHDALHWDGENLASDSRVHHLAHIMACCAIELDALSVGMLKDDRPTKGATSRLHAQYIDTSGERVKETPKSVHDESSYLASFSPNGSRIITADEIANMRDYLTAEELKGFGIGDVEPAGHSGANVWHDGHPLRHVTLPEDRL